MMTTKKVTPVDAGSLAHSKKRNSLLLMAFLVGRVSSALVEGDRTGSQRALRILKRAFKRGTALNEELRLLSSLKRARVSSSSVAASLLAEVRCSIREQDPEQIDREKSLLIANVNRELNEDGSFFDQNVSEYRELATLQTLANAWRSGSRDLVRIASWEDEVVKKMTAESKQRQAEDAVIVDEIVHEPGEGRLLMKAMMKRLNERYAGAMNERQRELVRAYAFSMASDDADKTIRMKMSELRDELIENIDRELDMSEPGEDLREKLVQTREKLLSEDVSGGPVDDATVTRFMLYAKLEDELGEDDERR